jgi:hypothetical protein
MRKGRLKEVAKSKCFYGSTKRGNCGKAAKLCGEAKGR